MNSGVQNSSFMNQEDHLVMNKYPGSQFYGEDMIYHISIIDYLQEWNLNKKGERFIKTVLLQKDGVGLSAIEPVQYAKRFSHFMEMNVFV
jgi:hypothetical protein